MKALVLVLLFSHSLLAYENDLALRAGVTYARTSLDANLNTQDDLGAVGFNTHYGYKWTNWAVDISSYFFWGSFDRLSFNARNETITGEGSYRNVSFTPMVKYHFEKLRPFKGWKIYTGAGPLWALQSVSFESANSTGSQFNLDQKITYESFGGIISLGLEEALDNKEDHPFYVELSFGFKKSYEVSVVDKSNFAEIDILSKQERDDDLEEQYIALSIGLTIF